MKNIKHEGDNSLSKIYLYDSSLIEVCHCWILSFSRARRRLIPDIKDSATREVRAHPKFPGRACAQLAQNPFKRAAWRR